MRAYLKRKYILMLIIWLSSSLTTPLIHGYGYDEPGFFLRILLTGGIMAFYVVCAAYWLFAAAIPFILAVVSGIAALFVPETVLRLWQSVWHYLFNHPLFWPVVMIAGVTLIIFILLIKFKNNLFLLFIGGIAVFVPHWYLFVDSAYISAIFYALGWLVLMSCQNVDRYKGAESKESESDGESLQKTWLGYTSYTLAAALAFSLVIPKGFAPLPLTSFHYWLDRTFPAMAELRGGEPLIVRGDGEEFTLYAGGMEESGRLGGALRQDPMTLMEIRGSGGHYLRGSVRNIYTGSYWFTMLDTSGWVPAEYSEALENYLSAYSLRITHERLRTTTVFTLLYNLEIGVFGDAMRMNEGGAVFTPEPIPLNREYPIHGKTIAFRGDFSALEQGEPGPELAPWLGLPAHIPARVVDLALDVTENENSYFGKMKALESYLRENFQYNENMPHLPPGRDFVDFFLFDVRAGYCTAFATSLAVMGRIAGVPTRYVQGFVMPDTPDSVGIYRVAGTNAHAWVEAYIPNLGWIPFEATPGFLTLDMRPERRPFPLPEDPPLPDEPNWDDEQPFGPEDIPQPFMPGEGLLVTAAAFRFILFTLIILLSLLAILFAGVIIYRYRRVQRNLLKLRQLDPPFSAAGYYNAALTLLARLGFNKYPGETPREYGERIGQRVFDWKLDFGEISEGMNGPLYSGSKETPSWLLQQSEEFFQYIFHRYIAEVGKITAFSELYLQKKYFYHFPAAEKSSPAQ